MYVKKEELRAAIVTRIEHVQTDAPERVKTADELRGEFYALQDAFADERTLLFKELVTSGKATVRSFSADKYDKLRFYGEVVPTPELQKTLDERNSALRTAEVEWRKQAAIEDGDRRKRHGRYEDRQPTSLRELEAWLTRLDNDVKTATINITRQFAAELGLA